MSENIPISNHGVRLVRSPLRLDALGSIESTFILDQMDYRDPLDLDDGVPSFERAGPREQIFFEPAKTKVAIVTCGGLCPGLNNVLRSLYLQLHYHYGVPAVLGIRYGYSGFSPDAPRPPLWLNAEIVNKHPPIRRHAAGHLARSGQRRHHRRLPGAARHQHSVHGRRRRHPARRS